MWFAGLDNRYQIEVHRTGSHSGKLYIFNPKNKKEEIASWDVNLSYGAQFGPAVADVAA